ncbi:hypothetical protein L0152_32115 [bacterium]|nr:hypothetical protein [bacterium]
MTVVHDLNELIARCKDSPGYVLFAAIRTGKFDETGMNETIDYEYRRYHFSLEDAKASVRSMNQSVVDEIAQIMRDDPGN